MEYISDSPLFAMHQISPSPTLSHLPNCTILFVFVSQKENMYSDTIHFISLVHHML